MKKLSSECITSIDEYGNRIGLNPAEVSGKFRTRRTWVQNFLILFFLFLPWIDVGEYQSILLNIPEREFYFFGLMFKAHNAPLLLFLILGGALSLAFVTAVWGRIWCGWACPQTVFIDGIFRRIEFLIEGNYVIRRRQAIESMTLNLFLKKIVKWVLFYLASAFIAHSALAYFVGSYSFIQIIKNGPENHLNLFIFSQVITAILLFDFGWFREQFCTIMCPYGRIQGLLLDENSLTVVYDEKRNDCVNCNRCVNACPIGIDIRNGLQMECIACTACIDACDEIMEKVQKPKGLIKYGNISNTKISFKSSRALMYLVGVGICFIGLLYGILSFQHSEAFILRSLTTPYNVQTRNGTDFVTNQFRFHVTNQSPQTKKYKIEILNSPKAEVTSQFNILTVESKNSFDWHFFVTMPKSEMQKTSTLKIKISDAEVPDQFKKEFDVQFLGPAL
jgi:cytochrome c oxidase accessory protein FixG